MGAPATCSFTFSYGDDHLSLGGGTATWDAGQKRFEISKTWKVPQGAYGRVVASWICTYAGLVIPGLLPWMIDPPPTPTPTPVPDWTLTWKGTAGTIGGQVGLTLILSRAGADCQVEYIWPSGVKGSDSMGALGRDVSWFWDVPPDMTPGNLTFDASCVDWDAGRTHGVSGSIPITAP
jgi:hypothetical protein